MQRWMAPAALLWALFQVADASAAAAPAQKALSMPAQPLDTALTEIARRFNLELAYSIDVIGQRSSPALSGRMDARQALSALLAGSDLTVRQTSDGGFVITALPATPQDSVEGPPVPDILVVGKRTQNADIRRLANDIQPYQVITSDDVQTSHSQTIEELIGKRIPADAVGLSLAQLPLSGRGMVQSAFNLRGLGTDETLLLVDGRRMPRQMTRGLDFLQPDVNALSPEDIDRAEVFTSTAGGIYGPDAIGGVVNLVLRRDYRGGAFAVTRGVSERGDGPYRRIDARIGFTPDGGATDVMVAYSRAVSGGLEVGDRDYLERAEALRLSHSQSYFYADLPISNSINVASSDGQALTLKPGYGGGSLGSAITHLLPTDGRSAGQLGAALFANAGSLDLSPASDAAGQRQSLLAARHSSSLLANARHRFSPGIQVYVDYIRLSDRGTVTFQDALASQDLSASDPRNPFQQDIGISVPMPDFASVGGVRSLTTRLSAGSIINLPHSWRANLDYSVGKARQKMDITGTSYGFEGYAAMFLNIVFPGRVELNPFDDPNAYRAALASYSVPVSTQNKQLNRFEDMTARLAGPVIDLAGGPLSATLLAERRREHVLSSIYSTVVFGFDATQALPEFTERVRSFSIELRAPVLSETSRIWPLRGLEIQAAVRNDATHVAIPIDPAAGIDPGYDRFTSAHRAATLYTAGLKIKPVSGLMVRASIATGEMSPPLSAISNVHMIGTDWPDSKRGGRLLGSEAPYNLVVFGKGKITPERARSISAGIVATPFGPRRATLSLDYTHIRRSHEVDGQFVGEVFYFMYNEAYFPNRITRLPLTAADAARGFTGGIVTKVDTSYLNDGWTDIDALDARLEVPIDTGRAGTFKLHGAATWQPRFRRFVVPTEGIGDFVNSADGILEWRGNAGVDWSHGPAGLALNALYYGAYHVTYGDPTSMILNPGVVVLQGSDRIGSQLTFDLAASYRFTMPSASRPRTLNLRFGIQDLFDRRPSTLISAEGSYSYYGDPRRRRFELTAAIEL